MKDKTYLKTAVFSKTSNEKHIVYAEVYAPYEIDTWGDMMEPQEIEAIAHEFIASGKTAQIDVMHDNRPSKSRIVESFIAKENDPNFTEGAWVVGIKINDPVLWKMVKSGVLNGLSMEIRAKASMALVTLETMPYMVGETEAADGHTHFFFVAFDGDRVVTQGRTSNSSTDGHSHSIIMGTATEASRGHSHRFFI